MHLPFFSMALATLVPLPDIPVSKERLAELLKTLEEPRSGSLSGDPTSKGIPPDRDFHLHYDVMAELERAGDTAIAPLIALYEDHKKPSQARSQAAATLMGHLVGWLKKPNPRVIAAVKRAIHDKDPAVRENVLGYSHRYGINTYLRLPPYTYPPLAQVTFSLAALKEISPDIVAAIDDDDPGVAARAAESLFWLGQPGIGVTELLVAVKRKNRAVLGSAVFTLSEVGRDDPRVLPAIREQLNKKDPSLVIVTAQALERFGPKAKDAVPQLIECLNNSAAIYEDEFGEHATKSYGPSIVIALGSIGPDAKAAIPDVLNYFRNSNVSMGSDQEIIKAIGRIDPEAGREAQKFLDREREEFRRRNKELMKDK